MYDPLPSWFRELTYWRVDGSESITVVTKFTHGDGTHHIIGHSDYLEPGHYGGLKVEVLPPANGTQTLTAMLHQDDVDRKFSHSSVDSHYTDGLGPIRAVATVSFKE